MDFSSSNYIVFCYHDIKSTKQRLRATETKEVSTVMSGEGCHDSGIELHTNTHYAEVERH